MPAYSKLEAANSSSSLLGDDVLVRVENVSKKFCRSLKKSLYYGAVDIAHELNPFSQFRNAASQHAAINNGRRERSSLRNGEFWAVENASFELRRGECLGLIGRNGAGKTTLLKILNGLIKPDGGKVAIYGSVGAMIALGAGFNPILTGKENVYINASVLGQRKRDIDSKLDEIIEFAGIGEFIDMPVCNYSTGMQVRLGFAIASCLDPDVLLIDEVLAVGDTAFKQQCYNRIRDLLPRTAVIFVSHSMFDIARICSKVLVIDKGEIQFAGEKKEAIHIYNQLNSSGTAGGTNSVQAHLGKEVASARITSYSPLHKGNESSLFMELQIVCNETIGDVRVRVVLHDDMESSGPVAEWDSLAHGLNYTLGSGANRLQIAIEGIRLRSGNYRVLPVVTDMRSQGYYVTIEFGLMLNIQNSALSGAHYRI